MFKLLVKSSDNKPKLVSIDTLRKIKQKLSNILDEHFVYDDITPVVMNEGFSARAGNFFYYVVAA